MLVLASPKLWSGESTLLPSGAVWRYLDTGVDPGEGWRGATFDDSAWPAGSAQIGYPVCRSMFITSG
jgi:hypothetical protein